ncbi:MAG: chromosomal replication initiator protein DnaA [Deltaproteobacteria bacterium]|nr:chromosomal replication initiator protein DnaA [Deltaproteobacteria bacterium]
MSAVWEQVKNDLQSDLSKNSFSLWIHPISCLEATETSLVLGCPNRFSKNWVVENYLPLIKEKFEAAGMGHMALKFKVSPRKRKPSPASLPADPDQLPLPSLNHRRNLWLKSQFTFDRFIVGQSNEFAYSASRSMASASQCDYPSLLMLANTGLGKTHLSQAIGHRILEKDPDSRIFYMTAEDFTNEMIASLKTGRIEAFKKRYRQGCDVLLLEEVHFLSGKEKIQAELGYTLDALANDNKRIVFTSAVPPKDVPRMSRELTSRLTAGLVTTIADPDYETRVQILTRKAAASHMTLPREVIDFLAERLRRDVRQMESALTCLRARAELLGAKIDLELAKEVAGALASNDGCVTPAGIMDLVCRYYRVAPEMVSSASRRKVFAHPRNIYAYLCRRYSDETLAEIGKTINRSHSTVLYAVELVASRMKSDPDLKRQVEFLSKRIEDMLK